MLLEELQPEQFEFILQQAEDPQAYPSKCELMHMSVVDRLLGAYRTPAFPVYNLRPVLLRASNSTTTHASTHPRE
jgi:hypothetical protein